MKATIATAIFSFASVLLGVLQGSYAAPLDAHSPMVAAISDEGHTLAKRIGAQGRVYTVKGRVYTLLSCAYETANGLGAFSFQSKATEIQIEAAYSSGVEFGTVAPAITGAKPVFFAFGFPGSGPAPDPTALTFIYNDIVNSVSTTGFTGVTFAISESGVETLTGAVHTTTG